MKQETLEEAAENYKINIIKSGRSHRVEYTQQIKLDFIAGAKWQQERSYSDMQEYAISFSRFLELLKINHPELYWSKNVDELIEIYQDENRR
jgi:hypothetical protein